MLATMQAQRSGQVVRVSSTAGICGQAFISAYAASKFGLEGWTESLTLERKAKELLAQADAHRELSSSLAHDVANPKIGAGTQTTAARLNIRITQRHFGRLGSELSSSKDGFSSAIDHL